MLRCSGRRLHDTGRDGRHPHRAGLCTLLLVDPIICALACTTIATGLTRYLLAPIFGASGRFILPSELALPTIRFRFLERIPLVGPIQNNHSVLVYLALPAGGDQSGARLQQRARRGTNCRRVL